jgi:hypothetical protein
MTIRIVALAAFFGAAIAAQANAAQVIHAGDWETTMDGGPLIGIRRAMRQPMCPSATSPAVS